MRKPDLVELLEGGVAIELVVDEDAAREESERVLRLEHHSRAIPLNGTRTAFVLGKPTLHTCPDCGGSGERDGGEDGILDCEWCGGAGSYQGWQ